MLKTLLTRRMRQRASRLLELCELTCPDSTGVVLQPRTEILQLRDLLDIINALDEAEMSRLKYVAFDFSRVSELSGPWGVHFALLISLSRRLKTRVIATSLRGQPASVARLFSKSPDVQALCFAVGADGLPEVSAVAIFSRTA
ncbi:MAG: hypothetical protein GXP29_08780 [Planctomycetes bacterium]|nr:hypothetical protein [Planctomycetota bacterium]